MKIDLIGDRPATLLGLISGTSVDAIDAALVRFWQESGRICWKLLAHSEHAWPPALRDAIFTACRPDAPLRDVAALNSRVGEAFSLAAFDACADASVAVEAVTAVASHGQTVWHEPRAYAIGGGEVTATVQLGDAAIIAARTGRLVLSDFRSADMALGGQGAPLVPFADFTFLASDKETRVAQNLGGISNVTLLPAGGRLEDVTAFDTGPGNMVMDALAARVTDGRLKFDCDGVMAAASSPDWAIIEEYLSHPYFAAPPPKSTGRELFGADYADALHRRCRESGLSAETTMATATSLTVESVGIAYDRYLKPHGTIGTVILSGGGARNPVLVRGLCHRLAPARVVVSDEFGIPIDAKEAMAFALLGYCTLRGIPSNVPSATGARGPAILGKIALPPP